MTEKKRCKYCAEEIFSRAVFCRYCRKNQYSVIEKVNDKINEEIEKMKDSNSPQTFWYNALIWFPTVALQILFFVILFNPTLLQWVKGLTDNDTLQIILFFSPMVVGTSYYIYMNNKLDKH